MKKNYLEYREIGIVEHLMYLHDRYHEENGKEPNAIYLPKTIYKKYKDKLSGAVKAVYKMGGYPTAYDRRNHKKRHCVTFRACPVFEL
jgi:hypothetical protein